MRTSQHAIVLTEEQRSQLETLVRSRTVERQTALRCRIILGAAAGASNQSLARSLNINRHTVETWRERFVERGLAGLKDAIRPGRPPRLGPEKMETVITGWFALPRGVPVGVAAAWRAKRECLRARSNVGGEPTI